MSRVKRMKGVVSKVTKVNGTRFNDDYCVNSMCTGFNPDVDLTAGNTTNTPEIQPIVGVIQTDDANGNTETSNVGNGIDNQTTSNSLETNSVITDTESGTTNTNSSSNNGVGTNNSNNTSNPTVSIDAIDMVLAKENAKRAKLDANRKAIEEENNRIIADLKNRVNFLSSFSKIQSLKDTESPETRSANQQSVQLPPMREMPVQDYNPNRFTYFIREK